MRYSSSQNHVPVNKLFLTGGAYGTWVANEDLPGRIRARVEADPLPENVTEAEHLVTRQTELVKFLGHVGDVVDSSQFEDVMEKSTSLVWIYAPDVQTNLDAKYAMVKHDDDVVYDGVNLILLGDVFSSIVL